MTENLPPTWQSLFGALVRTALNAAPGSTDDPVMAVLSQTALHIGGDRAVLYAHDGTSLRKTQDWSDPPGPARTDVGDLMAHPEWPQIEGGQITLLALQVPTLAIPLTANGRLAGLALFENVADAMARPDDWMVQIRDLLLALLRRHDAGDGLPAALHDLSDEIQNATMWAMPDIVFEVDVEGRFRSIISPDTPRGSRIPDDMVGSLLEDVLPDDVARSARHFMAEIDQDGRIQGRIQEVPTGRRSIWYEVSGANCASRTPGEAAGYLFVMRDITARIEAESELRRLGRIVEMMTNLVKIVDQKHRIVWVNAAFERQTGHALEQIRGQPLGLVVGAQSEDRHHWKAIAEGKGFEGEAIQYDRFGKPFWITFSMQPLNDSKGAPAGFVYVDTLITERRELEMALRAERDFLSILMDTSVSAIFACDNGGRCVFANPEGRRLLPFLDPMETNDTVQWRLDPVGDPPEHELELPFARVMRTGRVVRGMTFALTVPGAPRRVFSVNASPLGEGATTARVVMTLADITAEFEAEENERRAAAKAHHDALHDALTGLPNQRQFNTRLAKILAARPPEGEAVFVLLVDLDKFKGIKTLLGHGAGDNLIRAVADRLACVLPRGCLLARIEGDNFMACVTTPDPDVADELADQIHNAMALPFEVDGVTIYLTVSVGISMPAAAESTPESLIQKAELATYQAKAAGGNCHAHFAPGLAARFSRRSGIVQALRQALRDNEFELAFQPKFSLSDGFPLIGAEALLRWDSPRLGRVGPDEFIPVAETAGVISDIDLHVIRIFTRRIGELRRKGHILNASLNLSPNSFENETLAERLLAQLATEDIPPETVTVEITETSLVSTSESAIANIERFRNAGILLSVDDFGTGYSSLSYLQRLIVSEVKIDKSFIQPLGTDGGNPGDEAIVRAILTLARSFGLRTVAEGVESVAQFEWLRREGCDSIQGYLGGRAVSPGTFESRFLRQGALILPERRAVQP